MEQPTTQVVFHQPTVEVATKEDLKVIEAKLSSLKAWGVAALVGGQVIAGLIAAVVAPREVVQQAGSLARAVGLF